MVKGNNFEAILLLQGVAGGLEHIPDENGHEAFENEIRN